MKRWLLVMGMGSFASMVGCPTSPPALCDYEACEPPDGAVLDGGDSGFDAPANCDLKKDPKDSLECIANSVGVFVSPTGADTNDGTREKPVATLGKALALVGGKPRIYVCEGTYEGSVDVGKSVGIYGGLKCDWTPTTTHPVIVGSKPSYAVQVTAVNVALTDVDVTAKAGSVAGESSIGVFANGAQALKLARVKVAAGAGVAGSNGSTGSNYTVIAQSDAKIIGNNGAGIAGAGPKACTNCVDGKNSTGGGGGAGGLSPGDGSGGSPSLGGGAKGIASVDGGACTPGGLGASPLAGASAVSPSVVGALGSTGWSASDGAGGTAGSPGQGGGGGGGGYDPGNAVGGAGGGGCGGCGGAAGSGGKGGGSSIAIVSFNSTITLTACELTSGAAADGGKGAAGQAGQLGGFQGPPASKGCAGGDGGNGGAGGSGAGGSGGVSVGIAYKGTKPVTDAATDGKITVGTKGNKGTGGTPTVNDGIDGVAQAVLQVP